MKRIYPDDFQMNGKFTITEGLQAGMNIMRI